MLNASLNGDSPKLILGVVWEAHRMLDNSFTKVPFALITLVFNPLRMARLVTSVRVLVCVGKLGAISCTQWKDKTKKS